MKGFSGWNVADTKISTSNTCTYTYINLAEGQEYDLNVIIKDKAGNITTSETKTVMTVDSSAPKAATIRINAIKGTEDWYKSNANIIITPGKDTGAGVRGVRYEVLKTDTESIRITEPASLGNVIKYKDTKSVYISEREVKTTGATSVEIKENGKYVVKAYTIDNVGHKSALTEVEFKIDAKAGNLGNISLGHVGARTAEISVTGMDSETGISAYYFDYRKKGNSSWATQHIEKTSERSCEYQYTNLIEDTEYNFRVRILDKAGNMTTPNETEWKEAKTQKTNQLPTITKEDVKIKYEGLNSLVFGITGHDENGDKLTYTLYKETTDDTGKKQKEIIQTKTEVQGKEVLLTIKGLEPGKEYPEKDEENNEKYVWKLMITDGIGTISPINSDPEKRKVEIKGKTLCTGTGSMCQGPFQEEHKKHNETCINSGFYYITNSKGEQRKVECHYQLWILLPCVCPHGEFETHPVCVHNMTIIHSQNDTGENGKPIPEASTCNGPNENNKITCTNCSGRGKFVNGNDETQCTTCKGNGTVSEKTCIHGEYSSHKYSERNSEIK